MSIAASFLNNRNIQEILDLLYRSKALVMDFDGTLVDSNPIKWRAFEKCFEEYKNSPGSFDRIRNYCLGNNHIPRNEKFRHVFEKILNLPYSATLEKTMLQKYANETTDQIIMASEIPGATRFIREFFPGRETALLSSTPHETLLYILGKRGLRKFFMLVQGAPVNKRDWLNNYAQSREMRHEDVLFIGDTSEDSSAAEEAGIHFVHMGIHLHSFEELFS